MEIHNITKINVQYVFVQTFCSIFSNMSRVIIFLKIIFIESKLFPTKGKMVHQIFCRATLTSSQAYK